MDIIGMLKVCINGISAAVLTPPYNFGFILFIFIIYFQYKRIISFQESVYGRPKSELKGLMMTSILSGMVAGIAISIPMTLIGVTFGVNMGIEYLISISVILMLIEPRFLCFSYSGGILSLIALIFNIKSIDVTGILSLVAILHLLEAVLIYFDGFRGAVPVFMEGDGGKIIGGFTMQRFWPIPVALILFAGYGTLSPGDAVSTPDWWPVVKPYIDLSRIQEAIFQAVPLAAILGYSDFTSSYLPKDKCKHSSYKLALFGLILLALSMVSSYVYIFKYIAALFAPIAHDMLIRYEKKLEGMRASLFCPADDGVKVLDTIPDGVGEKMGIQPGDTIISINNKRMINEDFLNIFFQTYVTYIWVDIKDISGNIRTLEYRDYKDGIDGLDILPVSHDRNRLFIVREKKGYLRNIIEGLIDRRKRQG